MIAMDHDPPTLLQPGETVRFRAITRAEFDVLASAMAT
jgi:allophanate hydrolase subunit 1